MKSTALLIACALPLAACNKSPQVRETNASVAEVAKAVRQSGGDTFVRPGKWASKVTIEEFEVPGMPPEMARQMKQTMAQYQERNFESCLTQDDVKQPKEDFFTGKNDQCRYDHFTMTGGKIDAVMRCDEGQATQIMRMAGNYSPDTYQMRMAMEREGGADAAGAMTMKMRVDAHRVGECTGNETKTAAAGGKK
jgi:uncharacterized protein DUF3617